MKINGDFYIISLSVLQKCTVILNHVVLFIIVIINNYLVTALVQIPCNACSEISVGFVTDKNFYLNHIAYSSLSRKRCITLN